MHTYHKINDREMICEKKQECKGRRHMHILIGSNQETLIEEDCMTFWHCTVWLYEIYVRFMHPFQNSCILTDCKSHLLHRQLLTHKTSINYSVSSLPRCKPIENKKTSKHNAYFLFTVRIVIHQSKNTIVDSLTVEQATHYDTIDNSHFPHFIWNWDDPVWQRARF